MIKAVMTDEHGRTRLKAAAWRFRRLPRAAAVFAAGGVVGGLLVRLLSGHG